MAVMQMAFCQHQVRWKHVISAPTRHLISAWAGLGLVTGGHNNLVDDTAIHGQGGRKLQLLTRRPHATRWTTTTIPQTRSSAGDTTISQARRNVHESGYFPRAQRGTRARHRVRAQLCSPFRPCLICLPGEPNNRGGILPCLPGTLPIPDTTNILDAFSPPT
jgi:hypothetical protein